MQARYYDSQIGRFYSTDPIGYQDQLNLYTYVHNDPVNVTDPTGLASYLMCRSVAVAGAHCFILVTNDNGSQRARFSYGPQRNDIWNPGKLVETNNSGTNTDLDDAAAVESGKGVFRTIKLNGLGFEDDAVVASGERVDRAVGTPENPGPTDYKLIPNDEAGNANSDGGAESVLQEANPEAAERVNWPAGAVGRGSAAQVGTAPQSEPFTGFIDNDTIVGNRCNGRIDC